MAAVEIVMDMFGLVCVFFLAIGLQGMLAWSWRVSAALKNFHVRSSTCFCNERTYTAFVADTLDFCARGLLNNFICISGCIVVHHAMRIRKLISMGGGGIQLIMGRTTPDHSKWNNPEYWGAFGSLV